MQLRLYVFWSTNGYQDFLVVSLEIEEVGESSTFVRPRGNLSALGQLLGLSYDLLFLYCDRTNKG